MAPHGAVLRSSTARSRGKPSDTRRAPRPHLRRYDARRTTGSRRSLGARPRRPPRRRLRPVGSRRADPPHSLRRREHAHRLKNGSRRGTLPSAEIRQLLGRRRCDVTTASLDARCAHIGRQSQAATDPGCRHPTRTHWTKSVNPPAAGHGTAPRFAGLPDTRPPSAPKGTSPMTREWALRFRHRVSLRHWVA